MATSSRIMLDLMFHETHHLQIAQGDITHEEVDAIVNAANSHLQHGGGVAAAIARAGGRTIQEESNAWVRQNGTISHSRPAYTSGGNMPCTYVIHAVGPVWGEGSEDFKMRETLRGCFLAAEGLKIRSMSIPAISTGIYGFPVDRAAAIFYDEMRRFFEINPGTCLDLLRVVLFDTATLQIFLDEFKRDGPQA